MKLEIQDSFIEKLSHQVAFIAKDKPRAARKFRKELINRLKVLEKFPFKCRKSIYFDNKYIRDLIFKGYTITYKINKSENRIIVFGLIKNEESL